MASRRDRLAIHEHEEMTLLDFGTMEIWDGADLSLLRETLARLIDVRGCRAIGISMASVKYIPSGFFGMLFDWHERGVVIDLLNPQGNVLNMRWFQQFFEPLGYAHFRLTSESRLPIGPVDDPSDAGWSDEDDLDIEPARDRDEPVAAPAASDAALRHAPLVGAGRK